MDLGNGRIQFGYASTLGVQYEVPAEPFPKPIDFGYPLGDCDSGYLEEVMRKGIDARGGVTFILNATVRSPEHFCTTEVIPGTLESEVGWSSRMAPRIVEPLLQEPEACSPSLSDLPPDLRKGIVLLPSHCLVTKRLIPSDSLSHVRMKLRLGGPTSTIQVQNLVADRKGVGTFSLGMFYLDVR